MRDLGPCELPRHIRDQLVVRQRMTLREESRAVGAKTKLIMY